MTEIIKGQHLLLVNAPEQEGKTQWEEKEAWGLKEHISDSWQSGSQRMVKSSEETEKVVFYFSYICASLMIYP